MLAKFGDVSALEMDAYARAIASKKTNNLYDIRAGYCPDEIPFHDQCFDLICPFDVLEHIDQDTENYCYKAITGEKWSHFNDRSGLSMALGSV